MPQIFALRSHVWPIRWNVGAHGGCGEQDGAERKERGEKVKCASELEILSHCCLFLVFSTTSAFSSANLWFCLMNRSQTLLLWCLASVYLCCHYWSLCAVFQFSRVSLSVVMLVAFDFCLVHGGNIYIATIGPIFLLCSGWHTSSNMLILKLIFCLKL